MPVYVDHEERRTQIVNAAVRVLGEGGFSALTLRRVGQCLGGSVTLVTHYFPSRHALINGILEATLRDAREVQEQLLAIVEPHDRLAAVLRYFLPDDEQSLAVERARVALSSLAQIDPEVKEFFSLLEPGMRAVVAMGLEGFIAPENMDATVDLVRLWTSGIAISAVEHPEIWTPERQLEALEHFMRSLELPRAVTTATRG